VKGIFRMRHWPRRADIVRWNALPQQVEAPEDATVVDGDTTFEDVFVSSPLWIEGTSLLEVLGLLEVA